MAADDLLSRRFEQQRPQLRAVAYRMLGSVADAEDAVQNAWVRLSRVEPDEIANLGGWLTTVVAREALHLLRSRRRRREELVDTATSLPDPVVSTAEGDDPEQQALLADSVSLALLVVLESLTPAERVAFVLHDMFDLPFDEVARLVDRTPAAARQLASRARRRVRGAEPPTPDENGTAQRAVVDAFYAAANAGNFTALVRLLDPDVVFRADYGPERPPAVHRGAETVARQARASRGAEIHPVLVNGLPGVVAARSGRPVSLMAFTVVAGRIVEIDGIRDTDRVRRLTAGVVPFSG
ncbi:sigma-70 family RNA polymerase sigma factor [Saccharopolyspora rhizosphaerae]|uniref:Sigma-70 family RNA polymerase sigma factor n=1 Tax=Saccharopolyspora rhizosphaerae TaxID=2492662 RepID=A0A3R8QZ40_9PSEU|nr:sigma-70 family RNA polymerase sigma factor [Saccharopolyspora rhizosphaerae]RRO14260.1 sigma-70 family RNA polymerase sigma factor [Saccharopolyspora rhizosphaerae]